MAPRLGLGLQYLRADESGPNRTREEQGHQVEQVDVDSLLNCTYVVGEALLGKYVSCGGWYWSQWQEG